ncbi:MAG: glycoside hydrolase TIM-barrel-like domain-containing protein [Rickettsiales bacterium]|jgi:hypothetical protein|nr:glycoside hydrolase TIM-barrel-like domain-containing protein [Rickettsiales bacterium]
MTTFIFTQALSALNSRKDRIVDAFNSSPLGELANYSQSRTRWKKDKISGKLSEISIQTSTYSKMIPIVYGRNKLAGNVLWLGDVQEVANNNTTTLRIGKGQKIKQTSIEYLYFLSFAIAICAGEIATVENVWADTALLDMTEYPHRFYSGTETQIPDSLLESIEGTGNVTAYRGISYIVFENFPLSQFNNRIPNFLFEVVRKNEIDSGSEESLENCIRGINLTPPCGEFSLSTSTQYRAGEQFAQDFLDTTDGIWHILNENNNSGTTDSLASLGQLTSRLVNCQWFSVQTAFFGNSLDISNCEVTPRVSFNYFDTGYPIFTAPDQYSIGSSWHRYNVPLLGTNADGSPRFFNGTSSDASILSFFQELKSGGKKTVFHPKILMDLEGTPSSRLLSGSAGDVNNFFTKTNGYNAFILHYADLLKDYVDAFLIGSDLEGLTSLESGSGSFPAVDRLLALAGAVRAIVGGGVKISYGAGHREYHSIGGWFALDRLWASNYIDFVGINAYFPLTNAPQEAIAKDTIENGWFSGEGYDYETVNGQKIALTPARAYKNLEYWWSNGHTNPDGSASDWIPESKNIWFTEYGFRSIDCTTNDPRLDIGSLPSYSLGTSDFYAQRIALEATEAALAASDFIENRLVYRWDLRPYPFFPGRTDIWPDGLNWKYDYCLNGKTGISNANVLIYQLFRDAAIDESLIERLEVDEFVDGFLLNSPISVRDALHLLEKVYFFDCLESGGKISFRSTKISSRSGDSVTEIGEDELISSGQGDAKTFVTLNILGSNDLPRRLSLIFIDKNNNYDTTSVYAERESQESDKHDVETLPVVLDAEKARNIAEISLYSSWMEKIEFSFLLPMKYLYLDCSDLLRLGTSFGSHLLKIKSMVLENNVLRVSATRFDAKIYEHPSSEPTVPNPELMGKIGDTYLKILEIPSISSATANKICVFFAMSGQFMNWTGANLYFSDSNQKNYTVLGETNGSAPMGRVLNLAEATRPYYFDNLNRLSVAFHGALDTDLLESVSALEVYGGRNLAIYGDELLQFRNVVLNADGSYEISGLLRGLWGTEDEIGNHRRGDRFIVLGENLIAQEFDYDRVSFIYFYRAVTVGNDISKSQPMAYELRGKSLEPLAPCHFSWQMTDGGLAMGWEEKMRGQHGWASGVGDISLDSDSEYYLEIFSGDRVLEKVYAKERHYLCTLPDAGLATRIRLCQVSKLFGRGKFLELPLDPSADGAVG